MKRIHWLTAVALTGLAIGIATAGEVPTGAGMTIRGAGATFPAPLYQRWIEDYREERPEVTFAYDAVGSGEGIGRFLAEAVDFGASDAALVDAEIAEVNPERGLAMIPMTAGMVVLAYHIPGVAEGLKLDRDVYSDILAGKIRSWNDPRIVATNPDLNLPDSDIQVVVRQDSSGTTYAITNHLAAANPWWKDAGPGVGKLVDWPGNAVTARGNAGVAQRIKVTDGAIGYLEYQFAERLGLPVASLGNKAGETILPSPESGQAALASVTEIPSDLRVFVPDPEGPASYPIVSYTWILLYERYADPAKAEELKRALHWGLHSGQKSARNLGYIPLPDAMVAKATAALERVH